MRCVQRRDLNLGGSRHALGLATAVGALSPMGCAGAKDAQVHDITAEEQGSKQRGKTKPRDPSPLLLQLQAGETVYRSL